MGELAEEYPPADAPIVADPKFNPVICGCVAGAVDPAAMKTLAGDTATVDGSPPLKLTVTPPAGAGVPNVTAKATDCPSGTLKFAGSPIALEEVVTITVVVVSPYPGKALEWMIVVPGPTLVTGTDTPELFAGTVTEAGTVATPGLLELKLNDKPPAGAVEDKLIERFCVAPVPAIVRFAGRRPCAVPTSTTSVSPVKPEAEALMLADPKAAPVTCGCLAVVVNPSAIKTFAGAMDTMDVSLLFKLMKAPPGGEGLASVNWKETC